MAANNTPVNKLLAVCTDETLNQLTSLIRSQTFPRSDLDQALQLAVRTGQRACVGLLLHDGASVATLNAKGEPLLLAAVRLGDVETVKALIRHGYQVDFSIGDCKTTGFEIPLQTTIHNNDIGIFEELLTNGASPNFVDKDGNTALHVAAAKGNTKMVDMLIEHGAVINSRNLTGDTAVQVAVSNGHTDTTLMLLRHKGVDVNSLNDNGESVLLSICRHGEDEMFLELMVRDDIKIAECNKICQNALHLAAQQKSLGIVKLLLYQGVDCNVIDHSGQTALMKAIESQQQDIALLLLRLMKPDMVNIIDKRGKNALHMAAKHGLREVLTSLVETFDVSVDTKDGDGNTAINLAAQNAQFSCMRILIKRGANVVDADSTGNTPLHALCKSGRLDLIKEISSKYATCDLPNKYTETPLILAVKHRHEAVVEFLAKTYPSCRLDYVDSKGNTCVHYAVQNNALPILELLSSNTAFKSVLGVKDRDGCTPLILAVKRSLIHVAERLLACGSGVNSVDAYGRSLLFYVTAWGSDQFALEFVRKGANSRLDGNGCFSLINAVKLNLEKTFVELMSPDVKVNCRDEDGRTPLMWAGENGALSMINALLARKADPDARDSQGYTALCAAIQNSQTDAVQILAPVSKVNFSCGVDELSPLQMAIVNNDLEIIEILLNCKAAVSRKDKAGNNAIITATSKACSVEILELLLKFASASDVVCHGELGRTAIHWSIDEPALLKMLLEHPLGKAIDIDEVDGNGASPMLLAVAHKQPESADLLIKHNCALTTELSDGRQPIHHACVYGCPATLLRILERGVPPDTQTRDSRTPLLLAAIEGHTECCRMLIGYGATIDRVFFDAITPLFAATSSGHHETMEVLLSGGADPDLIGSKKVEPLLCAILTGDLRAVSTLLSWGATVGHDGDDLAKHPVTLAAMKNYRDIVEILTSVLPQSGIIHRLLNERAVYYFVESNDIRELLETVNRNPFSLRHQCRTVFRKHIRRPFKPMVEMLRCPQLVERFLLLQ